LIHKATNKTNYDLDSIFVLCIYCAIIPLSGFLNLKLIAAHLPVLFLLIKIVFNGKYSINISLKDITVFCFPLYCMVTIFWSINTSEAIHYSFNWLLFFIVYYSISLLNNRSKFSSLLHYFFLAIFCVLLSQHFLFAGFKIISGSKAQLIFNQNFNYSCSLLLMVFMPLLYSTRINRRFKFCLIVLLGIILIYFNSRGATLLFLLSLFYYPFKVYKKGFLFLSLIVLFLILLFFLYPSLFQTEYLRSLQAFNTIDLMKSTSVINGVGIGNWNVVAGSFSYDIYENGNFIRSFHKALVHNFPLQLAVETGLIGLVIFFIPLFYFYFNKLDLFVRFEWELFNLFFVLSCFYTFLTLNKYDFSAHLFIYAIVLGSIKTKTKYIFKIPIYLPLILALFSFFWFFYSTYNFHNIQLVKKSINVKDKIDIYEKLYSPNFFTKPRFSEKPIAQNLALLYLKDNNQDRAEEYFKYAILDFPYDFSLKLDYAKYLFYEKRDVALSYEYASSAYHIKTKDYDLNLLLAELNAIKGDWDQAIWFANEVYHNDFVIRQNATFAYVFTNRYRELNSDYVTFDYWNDLTTIYRNKNTINEIINIRIVQILSNNELKICSKKDYNLFERYCSERYKRYLIFYNGIYSGTMNLNENQKYQFEVDLYEYFYRKKYIEALIEIDDKIDSNLSMELSKLKDDFVASSKVYMSDAQFIEFKKLKVAERI